MANIKTNTTDLQAILEAVNALPEATAGVELPELTNPGTAADLLSGKELIDQNGSICTGTITTKTASDLTASGPTVTVPAGYYASQATKSVSTATQATPSISVGTTGLITANATQTAGYVSTGTKSATKQLTTQAAKTITPTKSSQTAVASGRYTTGAVTVAAIPDEYITTTDATATATDILSGETAYVNGSKVTGTMTTYDGSYECAEDSTGGSGGATVETCTLEITAVDEEHGIWEIYCTTVAEDGTLTNSAEYYDSVQTSVTLTVPRVSTVVVSTDGGAIDVMGYNSGFECTNAELIVYDDGSCYYTFFIDAPAGETAIIHRW